MDSILYLIFNDNGITHNLIFDNKTLVRSCDNKACLITLITNMLTNTNTPTMPTISNKPTMLTLSNTGIIIFPINKAIMLTIMNRCKVKKDELLKIINSVKIRQNMMTNKMTTM